MNNKPHSCRTLRVITELKVTSAKTPLIRLRRLSELTGCEILGKAEFMNPGGSVKDRAALGIIADAEAAGRLKPGDTIVEGTAGNTGIGLAVIGHAKGYRVVIVIPETQSPEKITLLRTLGAEVITVPEKPYSDPGNYNRVAQRLAEEKGWFWANQFDNVANRLAHYRTTGPEIWEQTSGEVSGFVSAVGTGGTLAGTALFFERAHPERRHRLRRPLRRRHVVVVHARTYQRQRRRLGSGGYRPNPRDEKSRWHFSGSGLSHSRSRGGDHHLSTLARGRLVPRTFLRHQPRGRGSSGA